MGQRLVVQINDGKKRLANAYYHWSGYTGSSAEMTNSVLSYIDEVDSSFTPVQKAAWVLFMTGARFAPKEVALMRKENIDKSQFDFACDGKEANRNSGLLCVSDQGCLESINWEEAHVDIDINTQEINFNAIIVDTVEGYTDCCKDYEDFVSPDELPVLDINTELEFTAEEWPKVYDRLIELICSRKYIAITPDKANVFMFIE